MRISRALVSVYNKEGIVEFARFLKGTGVELISSGGTARLLKENGIETIEVSDLTGFPEMMGGRVKTLHPKIHGAILANREAEGHMEDAERQGIRPIDMVVANLYPFEEVVSKDDVGMKEAVENIDIGGPTLLRAAAKNYRHVAPVSSPKLYPEIMGEMKQSGGEISEKTREKLALQTFERTSHYDIVIEGFLRRRFGLKEGYPDILNLSFRKLQDLRYGENPHQGAAFYKDPKFFQPCIASANQLQGKQLSYNNILDANAAFELVKEFDEPTVVVVKHNNPCGVASDPDLLQAYKVARTVDPEAAFGGILAFNREVTEAVANEIITTFIEVVVAPSYEPAALEVFKKKKNLRVLGIKNGEVKREPYREYRSVVGGLLVQDANVSLFRGEPKTVTKRAPTEDEMKALEYAWKICKYVKSNSIVYAMPSRAMAIGAGQMKRIDAAKLAVMIAKSFGEDLKGAALASDAFFPFRDGIDFASEIGVSAIIQPGGSIRDDEVIKAADEHNIAMLFTGMRHFRH